MQLPNRNLNLELARLIASFGVIIIHVHSSTLSSEYLSLFFIPLCVPYFFTTSMVFFVANLDRHANKVILIKIWERIAVPFLSWTVVYLSFIFLKKITIGGHVNPLIWRSFLFGESSVQLYYLITLIFLQGLALSIYLLLKRSKKEEIYLGLCLFSLCSLYGWVALKYQASGFRNIYYLISFIIYISFAFCYKKPGINKFFKSINTYFYLVIIIVVISLFFVEHLAGNKIVSALVPFSGISIFLLLIKLPQIKLPQWLVYLTSMSYGIYLCHIVFLEALEFAWKATSGNVLTYTLIVKIVLAIMVFALSVILLSIIRKFAVLKMLFLGESK